MVSTGASVVSGSVSGVVDGAKRGEVCSEVSEGSSVATGSLGSVGSVGAVESVDSGSSGPIIHVGGRAMIGELVVGAGLPVEVLLSSPSSIAWRLCGV